MDHPNASTFSNRSENPADQEENGIVGNEGEPVGSEVPGQTANTSQPADLFVLFASGYLKTCPYNSNHIVRETRFSKHLMKCRHTFVTSNTEEGTEVLMMPCRYNPEHKALAQELTYHEDFCPDKERVGLLQTLLDGSTEDEEDIAVAGYSTQHEDAAPNRPQENPQSIAESARRQVRTWRITDSEQPRYIPVENFTGEAMEENNTEEDERLPPPQNEDTSWYDWYRDPRADYYYENDYDDYFY